jgi:hypothetical protein
MRVKRGEKRGYGEINFLGGIHTTLWSNLPKNIRIKQLFYGKFSVFSKK